MYSLMMSANGHVDPHGTLPPPIIMHTAATPMPTPKSSLGPESVYSLTESRRGSGISMDPNAFDQKSLVRKKKIYVNLMYITGTSQIDCFSVK